MTDPNHLREQARKCRVLAKTAIDPELIEHCGYGPSSLLTKPTLWGGTPPRARDHRIGLAQTERSV